MSAQGLGSRQEGGAAFQAGGPCSGEGDPRGAEQSESESGAAETRPKGAVATAEGTENPHSFLSSMHAGGLRPVSGSACSGHCLLSWPGLADPVQPGLKMDVARLWPSWGKNWTAGTSQ